MPKVPPVSPDRNAQSSDLVRIVGVFYALVLGQAVINVGHPLLGVGHKVHSLVALGLLMAFTGASWKYLRFSLNIERTPYDVRWMTRAPKTVTEELRFGLDLIIAACYAYLLVQCIDLRADAQIDLWSLLLSLTAINAVDYLSTRLVRHHWAVEASKGRSNLISHVLLWWPPVLMLGYVSQYGRSHHRASLNLIVIVIGVVLLNMRELVERRAANENWVRSLDTPSEDVSGHAVYLASPLGFSEASSGCYREVLCPSVRAAGWAALDLWNISVADRQRIEISRGSNPNRAGLRELDRKFGQLNVDMIDRSFAVLAVLDGGDVDSGTAAEVGYASAKGKRVIGLRLDTRVTGDNEGVTVNLQVEHFLSNRDDIARTVGDAIHALGRPTGVRQVPR